jgi:Uma2 family endonuclease
MNVALRRPEMTVADFLDGESGQEDRWEFDGFQPVAMVGASPRHNRPAGNLEFALRRRLRAPCVVYRETVRLRLATSVRYPERMVVCPPVLPRAAEITDPVVIAEILSPGTFRTDRIEKNREYAAHSSILRYIVLEQDAIAAEVYARDGERWVRSTVIGDGVLALPEIGIEMPLAEAYAGLDPDSPTG